MFHDFRRSFLLYILLKVFLNQNINLVNIPGVPLLTLELFMNLCFIVYFLAFQRKKFSNNDHFPLKFAFILCIVSITISTIFSSVGFTNAFTRALQEIINIYGFVYVLWCVLREREDVSFLINGFVYIFIILGLYGFYEKLMGANPWMDYLISLNPQNRVIQWIYDEYGRLGMGRVRSAILHPIGFGVYLSVMISFYLFIQNKYKVLWQQKKYLKMLLFFLCFCCLFFTNSRSPLLYLFISLPFALDVKKFRTYQNFYIGTIIVILAWGTIEPYLLNITSFFDKDVSFYVGGSNLEMRIFQFNTVFEIFSTSPIFGLGIKSMDDFLGQSGIYGGESIWFWLMIERGLFGCISHLILLFSIARLGKGDVKYYIWGSVLAWTTVTTATSTPGISISFFLTVILITNKIFSFVVQEKV
jgi:hypothetical protein